MTSKLTKREAISECKRLWEEIEKSGKDKYEFLNSPDGKKWLDKDYQDDCPLCEYAGGTACDRCPLRIQYGKGCYDLGFNDDKPGWFEAVRGLK